MNIKTGARTGIIIALLAVAFQIKSGVQDTSQILWKEFQRCPRD